MIPQQGVQFPEHYRRLQAIEQVAGSSKRLTSASPGLEASVIPRVLSCLQNVVEAVRTAAQVLDLLAGAGGIDRQQLSSLSSRFLELVKVSTHTWRTSGHRECMEHH
jgi:hypothetical protein